MFTRPTGINSNNGLVLWTAGRVPDGSLIHATQGSDLDCIKLKFNFKDLVSRTIYLRPVDIVTSFWL
jgi:hypothetical protein